MKMDKFYLENNFKCFMDERALFQGDGGVCKAQGRES